MLLASVSCVIGVWVEKGMGLLIPGFIPTPAGDLVEYTRSNVEIGVSIGIWAGGIALFKIMAKVALAIESGRLRSADRQE